jgi:outer membrane immunogenic protein
MHLSLRNVLLAAALITLPQTAQADGMPSVGTPAPRSDLPEVLVRDYSWSGIYIGGHAGGATASWDWTFTNPTEPINQRRTSFLGGAQAGIQKQWSWIVLGAEVTYSWPDLGTTSASVAAPGTTRTSELSQLFTVTGRVGFAQDNMMFYFKGGWATADIGFQSANTGGGGLLTSASSREQGYVAGLGFEYGLHQNITIGLEYDFLHFNSPTHGQVPTGGGPATSFTEGGVEVQALVARLNFKLP